MLHALLHGKLDPSIPEPDRLEDALTSTVIGTLAMVDAWQLLGQWLQLPTAPTVETRGECWFWPRLAGAVEPDVIVRFANTLAVIEAKYRSGRNDIVPGELDEERPVDQIVRQYAATTCPPDAREPYPDLLECALRECRVVQLFVVDSRRIRSARREFEGSRVLLPQDATLRLVTWQELYRLLLDAPWVTERWATDLRSYLRLAGLDTFQGMRRIGVKPCRLRLLDWNPAAGTTQVVNLRAGINETARVLSTSNLSTWRPKLSAGANTCPN